VAQARALLKGFRRELEYDTGVITELLREAGRLLEQPSYVRCQAAVQSCPEALPRPIVSHCLSLATSPRAVASENSGCTDIVSNILQAICEAGIVIADISSPNPNVYYELGLCAAIGKDCRVLKQASVQLPADLAGAHYIKYSLSNIVEARDRLAKELSVWKEENDLTPIRSWKSAPPRP